MITLKEKIINDIKKKGSIVGNTIELVDYSFKIKKPLKISLGKSDAEYVEDKILKYSYYVTRLVQELGAKTVSRRAILQFKMENIPPECMSNIHFLIRDKKLIVLVNQRSLDVEKHFETDIEIVQIISKLVCEKCKIKLNYINFHINSCHSYI